MRCILKKYKISFYTENIQFYSLGQELENDDEKTGFDGRIFIKLKVSYQELNAIGDNGILIHFMKDGLYMSTDRILVLPSPYDVLIKNKFEQFCRKEDIPKIMRNHFRMISALSELIRF